MLAGCASIQGKFRNLFDVSVLLSAPLDVMLDRICTRTNNLFGKEGEELARIMDDHADIEPLPRASTDYEIATDRPVGAAADDMVRLLDGPTPMTRLSPRS